MLQCSSGIPGLLYEMVILEDSLALFDSAFVGGGVYWLDDILKRDLGRMFDCLYI